MVTSIQSKSEFEVINKNEFEFEYVITLHPQPGVIALQTEPDLELTYKVMQLDFKVGDNVWALWRDHIIKPTLEQVYYCNDVRPFSNIQSKAQISKYVLTRDDEEYILYLLNYNNELYISVNDVFKICDLPITIYDFDNNKIYDSDSDSTGIK